MPLAPAPHNRPQGNRRKVGFLILFLAAVLAASLSPVFSQPVKADALKWSRVNIPSDGTSGKWVLAEGSDLRHLTQASDGTLYCYANPAGTDYRLFKSKDNGISWSYFGRVRDTITDIAVVPDNPQGIYYATTSQIYKYVDDETFAPIAGNPGGAGSGNIEITSLDVVCLEGQNYIVAGTRDTDTGKHGGVYVLEENKSPDWQDTNIGDYDVYRVAFSPGHAINGHIIAIVTDEQDTVITSKVSDTPWGEGAGDARISGSIPESATIAFPADFNPNMAPGKFTLFIALNTGSGGGDVYRLDGRESPADSDITGLNVNGTGNVDINSLAVSGNADEAIILAGAADSAQIYFSNDAGDTWSSADKPPTGDSETFVLMAPDFAASGTAYAVTVGEESAFSISRDKGVTWNQTGLIDTRFMTILDLAVSPKYNQTSELFLITASVYSSLWYRSSGGQNWERIFCDYGIAEDRIDRILLSPHYPVNKRVLLGRTGYPFIWQSTDGGQSFLKSCLEDPSTLSQVNLDVWGISSDEILFIGSFNGENSIVYQTAPQELTFVDSGKAGEQALNSLVFSPNYDTDGTIMVGNVCGGIFGSNNRGRTFEPCWNPDTGKFPFSGNVTLAFNSNFNQNNTIYAASNAENEGIYRFVTGISIDWERIDNTLPVGAKIGQIVASESGALYAINSQAVNTALNEGGLKRSLNPATSQSSVFETITSGLSEGTVLKNLWIQDNNMWTVDTTSTKLLTYTDTLSSPVILTSPASSTPGLNPKNVVISWESLDWADSYCWQVSINDTFSSIPEKYEGTTDSTSVVLPGLDLNTTFYWRVRANQPVFSPWSSIWSFETNAIEVPKPVEPRFDSTCSITPVFRWSISENAEQYQLQLSQVDDFSDLIFDKLCSLNFWECNTHLQNNERYYWRVRAIKGNNMSEWSEVYLFTAQERSSSSSSSGSSSRLPTPVPPVTPSPVTSPTPTLSPSPGIIAEAPPDSDTEPDSKVTPAPATPTCPEPCLTATPATTPAIVSTPDKMEQGSSNSMSWQLFAMFAGLVVLTAILIVVVVFILKKFKQL